VRRASIPAAVVVLAITAGACTPRSSAHAEDDERPTCEAGFTTPAGFTATGTLEDPYADHVGIRLDFADDADRELHYFAGIPGEFGEGLPSAGKVEVAAGLEGVLQGDEGTWVLSWRAPGPCGVRAVLGSGFEREGFLDTIERAGIIPAR
jgi:hypothetical protein